MILAGPKRILKASGLSGLLACATLLIAAPATHGQGLPLLNGPGSGAFSNSPFMIGFEFTVPQDRDIVVLALGYEDRSGLQGLAAAHDLALWTIDMQLIATVTVPTGIDGSLKGRYWYQPLASPVTLSAGQNYIIVGSLPAADSSYSIGSVTTDQDLAPPGFTIIGYRWTTGIDPNAFPDNTTNVPVDGFWSSPNLLFTTASSDYDGDGIVDSNDACIYVANSAHTDADSDGFGNLCDGDFNNDCQTNAIDLGIFKANFFTNDPVTDMNSDGVVNAIDLGLFKTLFFQQPGPTGLANDCSDC